MLKTLNRHYLGKVILVSLEPGMPIHRYRYRWITRENDGRFYGRAPKFGVLIRNIKYKRGSDFGPERILPRTTKIYKLK